MSQCDFDSVTSKKMIDFQSTPGNLILGLPVIKSPRRARVISYVLFSATHVKIYDDRKKLAAIIASTALGLCNSTSWNQFFGGSGARSDDPDIVTFSARCEIDGRVLRKSFVTAMTDGFFKMLTLNSRVFNDGLGSISTQWCAIFHHVSAKFIAIFKKVSIVIFFYYI